MPNLCVDALILAEKDLMEELKVVIDAAATDGNDSSNVCCSGFFIPLIAIKVNKSFGEPSGQTA